MPVWLPGSFTGVSPVVEAGKYANRILGFADDKIKRVRKPFEFQTPDIFVAHPEERIRFQSAVTILEYADEPHRRIRTVQGVIINGILYFLLCAGGDKNFISHIFR